MTRSPLDGTPPGRAARDRDLDAEIEAHLAHRVDDLVASGLSEEEAWAQAGAEFGDPERIKAESRRERERSVRRMQRAGPWDRMRQDFAFFLKQLRRSPSFAVTALATLALGIGAAATIVSVVDAVVLEPLPFAEPDRVVIAEMLTPDGERFSVSEGAFLDWRERVRSFEKVAALDVRSATLRGPGDPRAVRTALVSHDMLDVLGLRPALGRMISSGEDGPGTEAPVAMLSWRAWRADFGADPDVVGRTLDVDGRAREVVGVMPPELELLLGGDAPLVVPLGASSSSDRGSHYLLVVARLAEQATVASASDELAAVQRELAEIHPVDEGWGATLDRAEDVIVGDATARAGWILLGAAGLLLLMACVNVANLLMVRATTRGAEMGLRSALGASRRRLVRQMLTESALLAGMGGTLGLLLANTALPVVRSLGEGRIPRLDGATLDGTTLGASLLAVAGASVVCGLAPVLQLGSGSLGRTIGSGMRATGRWGGRVRATLVGLQVATTVVLLVGTGLLMRSFLELSSVDPGFDAEGTLAVRLDMPDGEFTWAERGELFPEVREAVASLPGVVAVGATSTDPFSGFNLANFVASADRMPERAADFTPMSWRVVTPGFFEAMGMELRAGRGFLDGDDEAPLDRVVIGEGLARTLFGGSDAAVGGTLVWGDPDGSRLRVIGVVEDLRDVRLDEEARPIVYRTHRQIPWSVMVLVARVDGEPSTVAAGIRERIREAAPGLPVPEIRSLERNLRDAVAEPRFNLQILSSFALVGLLMALVGIYGLAAFDVRRRFREIGIRLSLGAEPDGIRSMIVRQRMGVTAVGLVVGLAVAAALTGAVASLLYGISPADPVTWAGVVLVVSGASLAATYLPARRATRVDPREVLNSE